jgi:hypothetical protein
LASLPTTLGFDGRQSEIRGIPYQVAPEAARWVAGVGRVGLVGLVGLRRCNDQ